MPDFEITSGSGPLSAFAIEKLGAHHFLDLAKRIRDFRYQRPLESGIDAVLREECGTCSSKHALLAAIAQESDDLAASTWRLTLGIFRMNGENTPPVGPILNAHSLSYLPEAHTYFRVGDDERRDFTSETIDINRFAGALLLEEPLTLDAVPHKAERHRAYLRAWLEREALPFSLEELWTIREQCIAAISKRPQSR